MKNLPLLLGTIVGSLLLIFGVAFLFSGESMAPGSSTGSLDQAQLLDDADLVTGAESPVVTIVEFSDFQCPACKAAQPLVKQILAQYPDQVQLAYRHFPLDTIHPNARTAAHASEVAAEEGKFWEYHDLLFDNQAAWQGITDRTELKETFASYAEELEIDKETFMEKIDDRTIAQKVQADVTVANTAQVNATPTFFVNGQKASVTDLLPLVESLLAEQPADASSETSATDSAEVDESN